jgi:putative acyl-CoA dehydrogenase
LALSKVLGQASAIDLGRQANVYLPEYKSHDTYGHRVDLVEYHPSYHALMKISKEQGIHSAAWTLKAKGHSKRAVLLYLIATA